MITNVEGYRDKAALWLGYAGAARRTGYLVLARHCLDMARAFRVRSPLLPLDHLR